MKVVAKKDEKKGFIETIKPNTPVKAAIWISAIGAIGFAAFQFIKKRE